MPILIENLLYQSEGTALDFKKEQYCFVKATDEQKSELLKDILAFANSWRQDDAYIVIGVQEVKGGRYIPIGTEEHFDDSILQQFINGKTNRKVKIAYEIHVFEGNKFGIIRISKQERPIYATKNYGIVKKEAVYYRLGSSTVIANPDDIARMGRDSVEVIKHIQLEKEPNSIREINKMKLKDKAWRGRFILGIALIILISIPTISLINQSDPMSVRNIFMFLICSSIFYYFISPYNDSMNLHAKRPHKMKTKEFVGKGRLMEMIDPNRYTTYIPTGKCIYPNCQDGTINIVDAPQREVSKLGKNYIGICSVAGKDHSYHVDNILVATLRQFDWTCQKNDKI